jgi:hypothetical protein
MTDQPIELHGKLRGVPLGPKLQACDERERIFAYVFATGIAGNAADAARLAGYSDPQISRTGKKSNSLRSRAHQILHRPRVIEAVEEICRAEFRTLVPLTIRRSAQSSSVRTLCARLGRASVRTIRPIQRLMAAEMDATPAKPIASYAELVQELSARIAVDFAAALLPASES